MHGWTGWITGHGCEAAHTQATVSALLEWHVAWACEAAEAAQQAAAGGGLPDASAMWLFALAALLERPLTATTTAALRALLRACAALAVRLAPAPASAPAHGNTRAASDAGPVVGANSRASASDAVAEPATPPPAAEGVPLGAAQAQGRGATGGQACSRSAGEGPGAAAGLGGQAGAQTRDLEASASKGAEVLTRTPGTEAACAGALARVHVLVAIAGAYFRQDEALAWLSREEYV